MSPNQTEVHAGAWYNYYQHIDTASLANKVSVRGGEVKGATNLEINADMIKATKSNVKDLQGIGPDDKVSHAHIFIPEVQAIRDEWDKQITKLVDQPRRDSFDK